MEAPIFPTSNIPLEHEHEYIKRLQAYFMGQQRITMLVSDMDMDAMMADFENHHFYGFDTDNVLFVPDKKHQSAYLDVDEEHAKFVPTSIAPPKVYGHGTASERVYWRNSSYRFRVVDNENGSIREIERVRVRKWSVDELYAAGDPEGRYAMQRHRINDLLWLTPDKALDPELYAFSEQLHSKGHQVVYVMLVNPPLSEKKGGKISVQKGGISVQVLRYEVDGKPVWELQMPEGVDLTDDEIKAMNEAAKSGNVPYINEMADILFRDNDNRGIWALPLPTWIDDGKATYKGKPVMLAQLVTGEVSFQQALHPMILFTPGDELTDLKDRKHQMFENGKKIISAFDKRYERRPGYRPEFWDWADELGFRHHVTQDVIPSTGEDDDDEDKGSDLSHWESTIVKSPTATEAAAAVRHSAVTLPVLPGINPDGRAAMKKPENYGVKRMLSLALKGAGIKGFGAVISSVAIAAFSLAGPTAGQERGV